MQDLVLLNLIFFFFFWLEGEIFDSCMKFPSHSFKGATDLEKARLHHMLLNAKDFVEANIFTSAKARAVELLEENWITYLKEDLKTFLE